MSLDLQSILDQWPYEPRKVSVRKIMGDDGKPKIQLRLDLGLLQMEVTGRPDGRKIKGFESLLDSFKHELEEYRREHGSDAGFRLSADDCDQLRAEGVMYYHRYLGQFALEDYAAVERDTTRNVELMDFCNRFGSDDFDREVLEQYRPYVLMMRSRARALLELERDDFAKARAAVIDGLHAIRDFISLYELPGAEEPCDEAEVLEALLEEIERREPLDPVRQLERSLNKAVQQERYEEAAQLRDKIRRLRQHR